MFVDIFGYLFLSTVCNVTILKLPFIATHYFSPVISECQYIRVYSENR